IPSYAFPEAAARVLSKAAAYADWRSQPPGMLPDFEDVDLEAARDICRQVQTKQGGGWLSATETRVVLEAMHLPTVPGCVGVTEEEARRWEKRLGCTGDLKLASRRLSHKTEISGVRLNLTDAAAVCQAFEDIRSRLARDDQLEAMDGVLIQPMITEGAEVM